MCILLNYDIVFRLRAALFALVFVGIMANIAIIR